MINGRYCLWRPDALIVVAFTLAAVTLAHDARAQPFKPHVSEIARGHSWVSPYWGYCAPKVVFDGASYYTVGLWGPNAGESEGVVYRYLNGQWEEGGHLPDIYQPPTLLLDSERRLIVCYTREDKPAVLLRARSAGNAVDFDELPAPPDMPNAYYPGAAIAGDTLYFAYATLPSYSMYLARLDLESRVWTPSVLLSQGNVDAKPKTAWTYPILYPTRDGVHLVASNCPDGGEGNTYNEVWSVFLPSGNSGSVRKELVADSDVGTNSFAMDMVVDHEGGIHIVFMWKVYRYGEPLPEGGPFPGNYHAYRDPNTRVWTRKRLGPSGLAGFHQSESALFVVQKSEGSFSLSRWNAESEEWESLGNLIEPNQAPAAPSFVDVLQPTSGSVVGEQPVLVTDSLLPGVGDEPRVRLLWAVLPADLSARAEPPQE